MKSMLLAGLVVVSGVLSLTCEASPLERGGFGRGISSAYCGEKGGERVLRSAVSFLRFLPQMIETCADDPSLAYYGTGESGHWAVQCSQQVMAALAILSEVPADQLAAAGCTMRPDELRTLALRLFRYSLRTHVTGDLNCTDGRQWGNTWISVLGLERSSGGVQVLEKHMTDDDRRRLKALMVHESDFRLEKYEIVAGITANNKPESNIWNASVMLRTAAMYPDLPQAGAYVAKAKKMLLNALTVPSDAGSDWYVGPNFTESWALDHHGYLNVGYMYECFSNLAFLHFWYKARGERPPEESLHHVADLWRACRTLTFPDGRLCRVGGDTRARRAYCQVFAVQAWIYLADVLGDGTAAAFEQAYLPRLFREQEANGDGSYFGKRLADVRAHSRYYYCRLEADAFFTLAYALLWHGGHSSAKPTPLTIAEKGETWGERYHGAMFVRTPASYRSAVFRAQGGIAQRGRGPNVLCVPTADSSLADWSGNLLGRIGLNAENDWWDGTPDKWPTNFLEQSFFEDVSGKGFVQRFSAPIREAKVFGEGQQRDVRVGTRHVSLAAVSDGATLAVRERVTFEKSTTLPTGYDALHLMIPNDVQNGFRRTYRGGGFSLDATRPPAADELLETESRVLTVDDRLSVVAVSGSALKVRRTAAPATVFSHSFFPQPLASERADEICMDCAFAPCHVPRGHVLYDVVYLVSACDGKAAARMAEGVSWDKTADALTFVGVDGIKRKVTLR